MTSESLQPSKIPPTKQQPQVPQLHKAMLQFSLLPHTIQTHLWALLSTAESLCSWGAQGERGAEAQCRQGIHGTGNWFVKHW